MHKYVYFFKHVSNYLAPFKHQWQTKPLQAYWINLQLKASNLLSTPSPFIQICHCRIPCVPLAIEPPLHTAPCTLSLSRVSSLSKVAGKWGNLLACPPSPHSAWIELKHPIAAFRPPRSSQLHKMHWSLSLFLSAPLPCLLPLPLSLSYYLITVH